MAKHNEIGRIGEEVAKNFLVSKGLSVILQNFWRPYGELDIVARETDGTIVFVEVKTVSWETESVGDISHEMPYPEENVSPQKLRKIARVIQTYLDLNEGGEWRFDVIAVFLNQRNRSAQVRWTKGVILDF